MKVLALSPHTTESQGSDGSEETGALLKVCVHSSVYILEQTVCPVLICNCKGIFNDKPFFICTGGGGFCHCWQTSDLEQERKKYQVIKH